MNLRAVLALVVAPLLVSAADPLVDGFNDPPRDARLRAYWWWLNGNVTKAAITRDLQEMKAKGFGGALICDADGSAQDGNERAKHGPDFLSADWRELYKHTLREADRLGLEMSLNIQSGWNLGGPMVTADDAAKKLVWSEARAQGPGPVSLKLPEPKSRDNYYRDLFVVAFPVTGGSPAPKVTASSQRPDMTAARAVDGDANTFWVSIGAERGEGPKTDKPEWIQLEYADEQELAGVTIAGRPGYGPRDGKVQLSQDGTTFTAAGRFTDASKDKEITVKFPPQKARFLRISVLASHDPKFADAPRNVQIVEVTALGPQGPLTASAGKPRIRNWEAKGMHKTLHFSAPDSTPLLNDDPSTPGEVEARLADVIDLSDKFAPDGTLTWNAPAGSWQILRFGCTIGDHSRVSTCSQGWEGYALDPLDTGAFKRYWDAVVEPLIADAGPLAGTALKYLHTDSWEVEAINWTPTLREEFKQRRGYDFVQWLPALTGRIVEDRRASNRFLHDFRKTLGDLAVDHHFIPFRDWAAKHKLLIHPESGGPHAVPIDAQRCLGINSAPMSEFWAWSWRHRIGDQNRFFVKQPASAAHTMGHKLVLAEGFTTIGPHWQETLWDNLKPSFDQACTEGLNLLVWHAFACSPQEEGVPGIQYFAGTHLNPNVTWWSRSAPFFGYINRCQFLLQQGVFVADAAYYYGDHVPNFAQLKPTDPAGALPGHDYDVITEEAILTRAAVRDGRIVLPDGMSYGVLVLRDHTAISLPVLRKLNELVKAGATVIGPKPVEAMSLKDQPAADAEVTALAAGLWGDLTGPGERKVGAGRIVTGRTAREQFAADKLAPDFTFTCGDANMRLDYVHRTADGAEIYFVSNRTNAPVTFEAAFRIAGKAPELWDPVTGTRRFASDYKVDGSVTRLPLELPIYGSVFVVFRAPAADHPATGKPNAPRFAEALTVAGPWQVAFDPAWGGPASATFDTLVNWKNHADAGIKYFSGEATYRTTFDAKVTAGKTYALDLGEIREIAEVRLNGKNLGTVWAKPFRVDATAALRDGRNELEVDVVNFWPNRIIGDQFLPAAERKTKTNVRKLTRDTALMDSGLLGPVRVVVAE